MKSKSFWAWLLGSVSEIIRDLLKTSVRYWYSLTVLIGVYTTIYSISTILISYNDTYYNKPNAPYLCFVGIFIMLAGIYGFWQKNVRG